MVFIFRRESPRLARATQALYYFKVIIRQIFISPGHNYFGHHGREPDDHPLQEVDRIECVAGQGIRGDRFFDFEEDYKGQITFFSQEVFDELSAKFPGVEKSPGVLRRNVIVSGVDLLSLIGKEFSLQGVDFRGTAHCKACHWMDNAYAPGAKKALLENAGLRAQILTSGCLTTGSGNLVIA